MNGNEMRNGKQEGVEASHRQTSAPCCHAQRQNSDIRALLQKWARFFPRFVNFHRMIGNEDISLQDDFLSKLPESYSTLSQIW
jgi:hypothetical protein